MRRRSWTLAGRSGDEERREGERYGVTTPIPTLVRIDIDADLARLRASVLLVVVVVFAHDGAAQQLARSHALSVTSSARVDGRI